MFKHLFTLSPDTLTGSTQNGACNISTISTISNISAISNISNISDQLGGYTRLPVYEVVYRIGRAQPSDGLPVTLVQVWPRSVE